MKLSALFTALVLTLNPVPASELVSTEAILSPACEITLDRAEQVSPDLTVFVYEYVDSTGNITMLESSSRLASGKVESFRYEEAGDIMITTIQTDDGHEWLAEDYVAPRDSRVLVFFDDMDTLDVTDDKILQIVNVCDF